MRKLFQAAGVAGVVLLSAVGCSNCCGSRTANACPTGQCATATPGTGMTMAATPNTTTSPMPASMAGKPMTGSMMPATGSMTPASTGGTLMPIQ